MLRIFFWQRTGTKVSLAFLAVAFGLIVYVILTQGSPPTIFELVWLLLPPFFAIYVFFLQPSRLANQAVKNEQLVAETTWEVSQAGVQISNRFNSSLMEWASLQKMITDKDYYLLLSKVNKNTFRFLPRRALTTPEAEAQFVELVRKYLPVG